MDADREGGRDQALNDTSGTQRDLPLVSVSKLSDYVGQEIGTSGWVTIEQRDIDDFARLTRDDQWIHIDRERAARSRTAFSVCRSSRTWLARCHFALPT